MKQRDIDIKSNDNTLFVTEQCNNRCVMCCQPPKRVNDIDLYFAQNIERVKNAAAGGHWIVRHFLIWYTDSDLRMNCRKRHERQ